MRVDNLLKQLKPLIPAALIGLIGLSIYYATDIYILFLSGLLLSYFLHVMVQAVNWVLCRLVPIKDLNHVLWGLSIFISILIYALLIGLIFWIIAPSITLQYKYFSNLITSDTYNSIIDEIKN
jgi:predicted PurR-regulated permease PerM